jgi:hypothetical protein
VHTTSDPGAGPGDWRETAVGVREIRTDFAESAQGVATDGHRWFVVSNREIAGLMRQVTDPLSLLDPYRNCRRVGVYAPDGTKEREVGPDPDIWSELVRRNREAARKAGKKQAIHLGAPGWARDALLVPTQRPSGVWVLYDDLSRQEWWPDPAPVRPERFSWIALGPDSGLLYTSLHWAPRELQALEWQTLRRVPDRDITLGAATPKLDRVQGGAFTPAGRVLLTSSNAGGQVFCYSASDGRSQGVLELGRFHEMEGIAVHALEVAGQRAEVHILDAGTDYWPFVRWGDSFAVRSYAVERPEDL